MVRIGISGWRYEPWHGVFYPERLAQRRELGFCGQHFSTVEINGSFYSLQRPEYYEAWYRETPPGFLQIAMSVGGALVEMMPAR